MLGFRAYRNTDAQIIAPWLADERVFLWWSAGAVGKYPLAPDDLNTFYAPGTASGEWFPRVMEEDGRVCGQMLMRWKDREAGVLHFGFIIVDPAARGKGLGAAMLNLALEYAYHIRGAQCVTLNVFCDNAPAIRCYERLGFVRADEFELAIDGEKHRVYRYEKRRANA